MRFYKFLLNETPELESRRRETLEREEKLSGERDAARLDLLSQLATARGQDLLQESQGQGGLLSTLEATQSKAKEIAVALEESRRSLSEVSRCLDNLTKAKTLMLISLSRMIHCCFFF